MKLFLLPACGLLAALTLLPGRAAAQGSIDTVRVEVQMHSEQVKRETPTKDPRAERDAPRTEQKTMQIAISGKPKSPETRTGHWSIYGHAAKGHDISVVDSGDFKIELPPSGPQKVESKQVAITFTPEHIEGAVKGKGGKKVEATGTKYAGYSVEVKDGDKVVGSVADPLGIKVEAAK